VRRGQPEVVVMDVRMPRMNGADARRLLCERETQARPVLILTTFQHEEVLSAGLRAGASGFMLKDAPGEEGGGYQGDHQPPAHRVPASDGVG
jgi:DNA-binding NarL/FixJ family response regulator